MLTTNPSTAGLSELCVKVGTLCPFLWTKGLYMCISIYMYTYVYTEPTTVSAFDVLKVKQSEWSD